MKNVFLMLFALFVFVSCQTEDVPENQESQNTELNDSPIVTKKGKGDSQSTNKTACTAQIKLSTSSSSYTAHVTITKASSGAVVFDSDLTGGVGYVNFNIDDTESYNVTTQLTTGTGTKYVKIVDDQSSWLIPASVTQGTHQNYNWSCPGGNTACPVIFSIQSFKEGIPAQIVLATIKSPDDPSFPSNGYTLCLTDNNPEHNTLDLDENYNYTIRHYVYSPLPGYIGFTLYIDADQYNIAWSKYGTSSSDIAMPQSWFNCGG